MRRKERTSKEKKRQGRKRKEEKRERRKGVWRVAGRTDFTASRSELLHRRISIPAADHGGSELLGSRVHEPPRRVTHSRIPRTPLPPDLTVSPLSHAPSVSRSPSHSHSLILSFSQSLCVSVSGDKKNREERKRNEEGRRIERKKEQRGIGQGEEKN
jgi:hypothetical protein